MLKPLFDIIFSVHTSVHTPIFALLVMSCTFSNYVTATNYYVNDASSTGDTYCTAIGSNSNNGLSAGFPKLTLKNVWMTYGPSGTNVLTSGDVIFIDAGTYSATGAASVDEAGFVITVAGLTFMGSGMNTTLFDHNHYGTPSAFFMYINASNVVLKNMTIREFDNNGTQTPGHSGQAITIGGAGVLRTGILLENVNFIENGLTGGNPALSVLSKSSVTVKGGGSFCNTNGTAYTGGIEAYGTSINLLIENSILANNYKVGSFDGAGLRIEGDPTTKVTVKNTRISNNVASHGGAISQTNGVLTVIDCIIEGNTVGQFSTTVYGGAFRINAGTAIFKRCRFEYNSKFAGTLRGGAIAARYASSGAFSALNTINLTIDSTLFLNNSGDVGSDIYAANGFGNSCNLIVRDCQFLTSGNFTIVSDAVAPASSISVTYFGTIPSSSGIGIVKTLSSNTLYTPMPSPPSFTGSCGSIEVLPIELIDFDGFCNETFNKLIWKTASEHNNAYFTIEKANKDGQFAELATIQGKINSTEFTEYSFHDYLLSRGISYYRLFQTDLDGTKRQLKTISVDNSCNKESDITATYNQLNNGLKIYYTFPKTEELNVQLVNSMGQVIAAKHMQFNANDNSVEIFLKENIATGLYSIMLMNASLMLTNKFIVLN
jgi:hypothetical protein